MVRKLRSQSQPLENFDEGDIVRFQTKRGSRIKDVIGVVIAIHKESCLIDDGKNKHKAISKSKIFKFTGDPTQTILKLSKKVQRDSLGITSPSVQKKRKTGPRSSKVIERDEESTDDEEQPEPSPEQPAANEAPAKQTSEKDFIRVGKASSKAKAKAKAKTNPGLLSPSNKNTNIENSPPSTANVASPLPTKRKRAPASPTGTKTPRKAKRDFFTVEEVKALVKGHIRYAKGKEKQKGNWAKILNDNKELFAKRSRTPVDLKDKFRNLKRKGIADDIITQVQTGGKNIDLLINSNVSLPQSREKYDHHYRAGRREKRKPWTEIEVETLLKGMEEHGTAWTKIRSTYEEVFSDRTTLDLKDKKRNLDIKALREKTMTGEVTPEKAN